MKMERYTDSYYQAVCDFLVELNQEGTKHLNWNWARWEWMYAHPYCNRTLLPTIGLWRDGDKVVGAAIFDLYHGEAFCGALPGFESLLPEIYGYAWENLRDENGLGIAAADTDMVGRSLLRQFDYEKAEQREPLYVMSLEKELPYQLSHGFSIREIRFPKDMLAYKQVIYKGFDHEGDQVEWENMLRSKAPMPPHLQEELCLAVVDRTGAFVAHCTCWYDKRTDYAYIEPVCTVPAHRGKGLGRAVVCEALNRCAKLDAKRAIVLSDQMFYQKLGFVPLEKYTFYWKKV